jgi:hypothetical protein
MLLLLLLQLLLQLLWRRSTVIWVVHVRMLLMMMIHLRLITHHSWNARRWNLVMMLMRMLIVMLLLMRFGARIRRFELLWRRSIS